MTNQLLPLLELGANNRMNRASPERAKETIDQGFSMTFQDAKKKIAANKTDAQTAQDKANADENTADANKELNTAATTASTEDSPEGVIDPAALQQLVDELFVDSSQLPLAEVAETINQAIINQPLTIASGAQLISDLKKFGQLSPATESAGLKLSAALMSQAELSSFVAGSMNGERFEKLTLQASNDKLNFAQLLNPTATASEPSNAKLSTDISPLQSLANIPLTAAAAAPKPQLAVGMPFQQAQWGEAVAERVMWMSSQGLQEAEIHLNPADLGPMQVKVSLVADQAHVSFVVSNASVREALDQNAIRLREMFNGEGLNLVDVDVSDQSQHQASSSDDDRNNPQFSGERAGLDLVQGENQLSIHSNGKGMLSLYA